MRVKLKILLLAVFTISAGRASAAPVQHLKVEPLNAVVLGAGKPDTLTFSAVVAAGFHIQANPASRPNLIATKVDLKAPENWEVGMVIYPKAKPYKIAGLNSSVDTYDGRVEFKVPLNVPSQASGSHTLEGKIRYQACDDKVCFPPTLAKFTVTAKVVQP